MMGQRHVEDSHFVFLLTLFWLSLNAFCLSPTLVNGEMQASLSEAICEDISGVEVRFREYFHPYLGIKRAGYNYEGKPKLLGDGQVVETFTRSAKSCCPKVNVYFVLLSYKETRSIQSLVKDSRLNNGSKNFVFYFPEFSNKGLTQVYFPPIPFLPVIKSPGHAVIMRTADAKAGSQPLSILAPSLPIIAVLFSFACLFGVAVWCLDHRKNAEEFPSPFIIGVAEGLWWAVVTMTTVGYGDKAPKSLLARLLTVFWMFFSFIAFTLIAANTTSIIATQQLSVTQRTIGLRIGVTNSKHFMNSEMNLGAEIVEYNYSLTMLKALRNGDIDRLIFPNYPDFLVLSSMFEYNLSDFYVAKVLNHAFQVGLVMSQPSNLSHNHHQVFYSCLNGAVAQSENKFRSNYSSIKQIDPIKPGEIDTTYIWRAALFASYGLACVIAGGLAWDAWKYFKDKAKRKRTTQSIELQQTSVSPSWFKRYP